MPEYTKAEEGLRKYSAVGQVWQCSVCIGQHADNVTLLIIMIWQFLASDAFHTLSPPLPDGWQVLTSVAVHAISSLPFGAPVGALLGAVFSRAAQVWGICGGIVSTL